MIAFHGDKAIKDKYIARIREHRRLDQLVKRAVGQEGKGCAVWCTLDKYDHAAYEDELGIPRALARMEDVIFECLPWAESMEWPEAFLNAIPLGADLSRVILQFWDWLFSDPAADRSHQAAKLIELLQAAPVMGENIMENKNESSDI
jgi:hypothetical protein